MSNPHTPIPGPSGLPFLGNILDIDANSPAKSLEHLADLYGKNVTFHQWGLKTVSDDLVIG
jgi:cytochrome P450/NADPH-cytochrome P450 reductase